MHRSRKMAIRTKARAPTPSLEALAKLQPVFAASGSVTAGNSSQTVRRRRRGDRGLREDASKQVQPQPLARFLGFAVAGVPPEIMGIGPKDAIPQGARAGGLKQDDLDWIELNEAFAAQALAVISDLGSIRRRSIRSAAPSRSAIRSAPPARSAPRPSCTACAAASRNTAW